ncbi:MAG: cell division protein FtsA [Prevotellaceae bacterium]|jgi:cell division protein FtsA|nr:cell division protein FtsA [Prevotellaceae bacterium]
MEALTQLPLWEQTAAGTTPRDGKLVAAVDVGTTKVITLVGEEAGGGKVHVLAHSEAPLPRGSMLRGEVRNEGAVRDAIAATVADIRERCNIDIRSVYTGMAGSGFRYAENTDIHLRTNGSAVITESEVKEIEAQLYGQAAGRAEQILYVAPQEYGVDNRAGIANPVGIPGKRLSTTYRLFIGHAEPVDNLRWCIENAGLHLKRGLFKPLAAAQAVLSEDEKEMGVAVVDLGGGTTSAVVWYDNTVRYAALIPFGGNTITDDICDGCGVLRRHANAIKIQHGSCYRDMVNANTTLVVDTNGGNDTTRVSFAFLAGIIEARIEEIIEAVMYEIDRSGYADRLPGGLVFTGGGAMMQHLKEFVSAKTGMPVRIARPQSLTSDSPKEVRQCHYATAVGLLVAGIAVEKAAVITTQMPAEAAAQSLQAAPMEEEAGKQPVEISGGKKGAGAKGGWKKRARGQKENAGSGGNLFDVIQDAIQDVIQGVDGLFKKDPDEPPGV